MHPILARGDRLALYLIGWIPIAVFLSVLLVGLGGFPALAASLLPLVLAPLYAFACLAAWYPCRVLPLTAAGLPRALGYHLVGALLSSAAWVLAGYGATWLLGRAAPFRDLPALYGPVVLPLLAVGVLLYLLSAVIHYLVMALAESREAERRALELRALAREAELRALRAQIDPHFLFNSLNSVSALVAADPAAARAMCLELSEVLRASLRLGARERIPLADELALVGSFLAVEKARFGPRLAVEERVEDAARACPVPPLVLQPLVENAIRHGIAHLVEGGAIRLAASLAGGRLELAVENPCDPDRPRGPTPGVGLANVRSRLVALYGTQARFEAAESGGRFRVAISLPAPLAVAQADGA